MICRKVWSRLCIVAAVVACSGMGSAWSRELPTFYGDIQPLIYKNCTGCHRPGQTAPFALITYNDVVKHAATIKYVTGTGYMPPWKADTAYNRFRDERILSKEEISLIAAWVNGGMQKGNEAEAVQLPVINESSNLGVPDLVLTAPEIFKVPGTNQDTVVYSVMHYSIASDTNVLAFEFSPGNPLAVHHSNTWVFPDPAEYSRFYPAPQRPVIPAPIAWNDLQPGIYDMLMLSQADTGSKVDRGFEYPAFFPKVAPLYYDGWVPGASARTWPAGFGFRLPRTGLVIMQLHYGPTAIERLDQSSVKIFYTNKPVARLIESFNIGSGGGIAEPEPRLVLPPDSIKSFDITAEITRDQSYLALNPHMHYLGKEMKAFAVTLRNDTIPLVWIRNWDFRWQEFYKPRSLIHIPAGSVLHIHATYDNTAGNPENRFNPPKQIMGGANSTDEMMSLIIMSVDYRDGDEAIMLQSDLPGITTKVQ
jgi:hypothetical protein